MTIAGTIYFQKAGKTRPNFNPACTAFDRDIAWWLAECSRLAYENKRRVYDELAGAGFEFVIFFDTLETQGYLTSHPGTAGLGQFAVLAFRGTEKNWADILTDVAIFKSTLPDELYPALISSGSGQEQSSYRAHTGFVYALKVAWGAALDGIPAKGKMKPPKWYGAKGVSDALSDILEEVGHNVPIFMTGHSLGGALATLTSCPQPPAALYTFGCPRVVDSKLAKTLDQRSIPVFRVVNSSDIVPRVPSSIWGFRHFGKLTYLNNKGECVVGRKAQFLFVIGSIITWIGVIFIILPFNWVACGLRPKTFSNHKISEYVRKLA
ncbi:MAG TPA: lipase family protein [Burkholderiales bacterium]|nr:lipase family protein [Burkholderiales bacterium]